MPTGRGTTSGEGNLVVPAPSIDHGHRFDSGGEPMATGYIVRWPGGLAHVTYTCYP
jgi:hypothetical protein